MFLMGPVTAVWGAVMFGEPFTAQTAVGLAIALSAVAVVHATGGPSAGPDDTTARHRDSAREVQEVAPSRR
ncbi:hypothetical protein M2271_005594 [Streptomyces sp. LBL]|nr:hypothetical protein [Streptomyces sp. LBL]